MAIVLQAIVTCQDCGADYEGRWEDPADTPQDLVEAPVAVQTCPRGHQQEVEYEGWTNYTEAG